MSATTRTQNFGLVATGACGADSSTGVGASCWDGASTLRLLGCLSALFLADDGVLKPTPKSLNRVASLCELKAPLPVAVTHTLWPSDTTAVHHVRPDRRSESGRT